MGTFQKYGRMERAYAAFTWIKGHWPGILATLVVVVPLAVAILGHFLKEARDRRKRHIKRDETWNRVRRDLLVRLISHCGELQPLLLNPGVDPDRWRTANATLRSRAEQRDVIQALGERYVKFLETINDERRSVDALERIVVQTHSRFPNLQTDNSRTAMYERMLLESFIMESASTTISGYTPFILLFGDAAESERLEKSAKHAYDRAKTMQSLTPLDFIN